ncbi:MAG: hypothetical protein ACPG52_09490 [Cognaticolwellia sp.]
MDSTQPLYRQLSSRLLLLALSFFVLCFVGFSLYFQQQQDFTTVRLQQLPEIEKYNQRLLLLAKQERLINKVLASPDAKQFSKDYQTLNEHLKALALLASNRQQRLAKLTQSLQMQRENVTRLTERDQRNNQLKAGVIVEMSQVVEGLSTLIAQQSGQERSLYRQIRQDNLTDAVTATRAKALSKLVNSLYSNRELQQHLIDTLVMFKQLSLQYDLVEFDYIQQNIQQQLNRWLAAMSNVNALSANEQTLLQQTIALNALLFNEQNTFAKWRGQLRRANDFHSELAKQKLALAPLLDQPLAVKPIKASSIEQQLTQWLALPTQYVTWLIIGVFSLLMVVFIAVLFSLRQKIKYFGEQNNAAVAEFVSDGELTSAAPALETTAVIEHIKRLSRPIHSEADFLQLQQDNQKHIEDISRHSAHVFFQLPDITVANRTALLDMLAVQANIKHWRQCFSRSEVNAILAAARQAKKTNSIEKVTVINQQKHAVTLTVEYLDGIWFGSLSSQEGYRALEDKSRQLHQQKQAELSAAIRHREDENALVSTLMLQQQRLSLSKSAQQLDYLPLQQLFSINRQEKVRAQLRQDDFVLALSTVNLIDELHTVLANLSLRQAKVHNGITLKFAKNVTTHVTLESELFQAMIALVCEKILSEQHGSELTIALEVVDVNSAQQKVRMSFLLSKASNAEKLSQVIKGLALDEDCTHIGGYQANCQRYLHDLQLVFNVSNKAREQLESAEKFAFDLPLAAAEGSNKAKKAKPVKLKKCSILVLANDKNNQQRITQQLKSRELVVDTMQDISLFQRQISIKHLTSRRLDIIILSPEVFASDYDLVQQHIATIPKKLQPKVLVIQPVDYPALHRTGLFSIANTPWFCEELTAHIAQLLSATEQSNLLVAPEIFSPYRFMPTQVEVLLAVASPSTQQTLLRLLHWFGLQVTVVSSQASLENLWRSGRFSVLISEFIPFDIALNTHSDSIRGVFALKNNRNAQQDIFTKLAIPTLWPSGFLAPELDIQKLSQQLSPWLKSANGKAENKAQKKTNNAKSAQYGVEKAKAKPATKKVSVAVAKPSDTHIEQVKHEKAEAFDLSQFAENQGSAELAALMLDDYIADINSNISALDYALAQQDMQSAEQPLAAVIKLAKIISANSLLTQAMALTTLLTKSTNKKKLSKQDKEALQQALKQLKLEGVQLTEFAESI